MLSNIGRYAVGAGRYGQPRQVPETQAPQGVADIPARIGQRRFEPAQSSNKTAFLRKKPPFLRVCKKSGKKNETPTAPMKHPFGPEKQKGASS